MLSHDLEDIITIVDGRATLFDEIQACADDLQAYLGTEFAVLIGNDRFLEALPGHLPGDQASQRRLGSLMARLRRLAACRD